MSDRHRYYVTTDERGERKVSKEEFVLVERIAGFNNTLGQPFEPATSSFTGYYNGQKLSGRMEYVSLGVGIGNYRPHKGLLDKD